MSPALRLERLRGLSQAVAYAATTPVLTRREALYLEGARIVAVKRRRELLGGAEGVLLLFSELDALVERLALDGVGVEQIWEAHWAVRFTPATFGIVEVLSIK